MLALSGDWWLAFWLASPGVFLRPCLFSDTKQHEFVVALPPRDVLARRVQGVRAALSDFRPEHQVLPALPRVPHNGHRALHLCPIRDFQSSFRGEFSEPPSADGIQCTHQKARKNFRNTLETRLSKHAVTTHCKILNPFFMHYCHLRSEAFRMMHFHLLPFMIGDLRLSRAQTYEKLPADDVRVQVLYVFSTVNIARAGTNGQHGISVAACWKCDILQVDTKKGKYCSQRSRRVALVTLRRERHAKKSTQPHVFV